MAQVPIIMPQLGESIAEATIVDIKVKPGDEVVDDQEIIDVETNKAVMGVTTPCKGKIDKITVQLKETYPVGAVLGYIEASEQDAARFAKHAPAPPPQKEVAEEIPARADQEIAPAREKRIAARDGDGDRACGLPVPAITKGATFMSPRVRARMAELQLTTADLAGIMGTGAGNRVTIKDLESFLHKIENQTAHEASKIRVGVADAMRRSWTRPLSTIGSSVNLDPVLQARQSRDPKPGLGLYALRALALALAENPTAAAKFIGNRVVQSNSIDIGIAVEAEDGIMVPVIRSAEKTSLADLTTKYKELIELARQRRISPDMQAGGIATDGQRSFGECQTPFQPFAFGQVPSHGQGGFEHILKIDQAGAEFKLAGFAAGQDEQRFDEVFLPGVGGEQFPADGLPGLMVPQGSG